MNARRLISIFLLIFLTSVHSWKLCHETFCGRLRKSPEGFPRYTLDLASVSKLPNGVKGDLIGEGNAEVLEFQLSAHSSSIYRVNIEEKKPNLKRPKIGGIILENEEIWSWKIKNVDKKRITVQNENTTAVIYGNPFKIEFYSNNKLISILNAKNRLVYETSDPQQAIALDVTFVDVQRAYGIPQHADDMALKSTMIDNQEPYRHYNLDYGRYRIKSPESLYGSVPVLYAHGVKQSSGVFWSNSAQTYVDILNAPNQVDAFFMSEGGALEVFVLTGPTLAESVRQYASLTGAPLLPQYFALGYHQSRYSYMTQDEVLDVIQQFDEHDLPVDCIMLDIDYTDGKKYFTWDPIRYSNPKQLQADLAATNRTLVAIIDPHIKTDPEYFLHNVSTANGFYVHNPDGTDYVGKCWPGESSWIDFLNPDAVLYYSSLYSLDTFKARNLQIWNDMNEPAIFDIGEHENTMSGDLLHHGGVKHRDVHNRYGFDQIIGTFKGLIDRFGNATDAVRPFILTRSHYAGAQRYAAIWTGDNYASWEYLQISFPMCLTEALAGISFCGADVGGFAGIPSDELYLRWYQAGAWLPFYRGHSATDVPRREPYLYPEGIRSRVRKALNQRYAHLPLWYTLFWENIRNGDPVIRPIIYNYPSEVDALSIDNQVCVGDKILAAPVLKPDVFAVSVYLPGGESEIWYNIDDDYRVLKGTGRYTLAVDLDSVPVFYRGGSIIPRKDIPRQTTAATKNDPYTLYVCLDQNYEAKGTLFVDDYESFNYEASSAYLYVELTYSNHTLTSHKLDPESHYDGAAEIGKIVVLGCPEKVLNVKVDGQNRKTSDKIKFSYSADGRALTIDNVSLSLHMPFQVSLE